ncbi:hypothetical protein [Desulfovibrio sp. Fe33]|uniref:hypothetical protein n=1 Tax=Desulfovibrio sp. Fe33 TaxID=3020842 RepID=UPI00234D3926|nr:hypothetical protein [Desulfovibrio sp. Fe33]
MKPRNIHARLERLEAQAVPQDMPRFWITPSWCELTYAEGRPGEVFHRKADETQEAFMARVEASTDCPCLHGFKRLTNGEWERIAQEYHANNATHINS